MDEEDMRLNEIPLVQGDVVTAHILQDVPSSDEEENVGTEDDVDVEGAAADAIDSDKEPDQLLRGHTPVVAGCTRCCGD